MTEAKNRSLSAWLTADLPFRYLPPATNMKTRFLAATTRSLPLPVVSFTSISLPGTPSRMMSVGTLPLNSPSRSRLVSRVR
ncbi:MAG: hypothetical protein K2V38_00440, partial [Gemmataceae bacterium]|nr:hypothetical protein [Gemmataceae bacterium]